MGFGAYLSKTQGWISAEQLDRILSLISRMELALWHPIMERVDLIWDSQVKMVEKRGGSLCAPLPKGGLGQCGYLNELTKETMVQRLDEYKKVRT